MNEKTFVEPNLNNSPSPEKKSSIPLWAMVMIAVIIFALCILPICVIVILALLGPSVGNVFSEIQTTLMIPLPLRVW